MRNYLVITTSQTPIAFRAGRDSKRESTLGYVPGSALWGGLATAHLRMRSQSANEFAEFFLSGKVVCGNLYPARFSQGGSAPNPLDNERSPVRPLPRTIRSCKRFDGFRFHSEIDADQRHGVSDSLIAWAAFSLSNQNDTASLMSLADCPDCQEPLDRLAGFYRRGNQTGHWGAAESSKGIFTRTSISRARGSAEEGMLYSREFLREGNLFCGEWQVDDELAPQFQDFVEEATEGGLRVGHNRTRGLGKLGFPSGLLSVVADTPATIEDRAKLFDAALRRAVPTHARHPFYLPITLTSDCIWPDAAKRYRLQITAEVLAEAWGINNAELVYCNADKRRVSGWNGMLGMPKADEWAITMGSVFLFGLEAEPDWQRLADGQTAGLGIRRAEGFGTVRIADEIHWEANSV